MTGLVFACLIGLNILWLHFDVNLGGFAVRVGRVPPPDKSRASPYVQTASMVPILIESGLIRQADDKENVTGNKIYSCGCVSKRLFNSVARENDVTSWNGTGRTWCTDSLFSVVELRAYILERGPLSIITKIKEFVNQSYGWRGAVVPHGHVNVANVKLGAISIAFQGDITDADPWATLDVHSLFGLLISYSRLIGLQLQFRNCLVGMLIDATSTNSKAGSRPSIFLGSIGVPVRSGSNVLSGRGLSFRRYNDPVCVSLAVSDLSESFAGDDDINHSRRRNDEREKSIQPVMRGNIFPSFFSSFPPVFHRNFSFIELVTGLLGILIAVSLLGWWVIFRFPLWQGSAGSPVPIWFIMRLDDFLNYEAT